MKSKKFESKLKAYTALATSVIAVGSSTNAQIIYTDVVPDAVCNYNTTYQLDLDGDAVIDFVINRFSTVATSFNMNRVGVSGNFGYPYFNQVLVAKQPFGSYSIYMARALNQNEPIDGFQTTWSSSGLMNAQGTYYGNPVNMGLWQGATDLYLGLKFYIGNQVHYGWARLDVDFGATSFTLKDYAYDSTPHNSILAGQMITDINKNRLPDDIIIYSANKMLVVDLKDNNIKGSTVKLYNLLGQEIKTVNIDNSRMVINVDDIIAGMYLVNVYVEGKGIFTKKIKLKY